VDLQAEGVVAVAEPPAALGVTVCNELRPQRRAEPQRRSVRGAADCGRGRRVDAALLKVQARQLEAAAPELGDEFLVVRERALHL
jgi:hypothetical protein